MFDYRKSKFTVISYWFIAIVIIWVSANLNWGDGRWNKIVSGDANGYYAYLPAIFLYHDLKFEFIDEIADDSLNSNINGDFVTKHNGNSFNKYYVGTSVALLPFFALGHITNWLYNIPLDGYSVYYRIFIQVGAIFYLLFGLFILIKILRIYEFRDTIIAITLMAIVFGTNIFYYVVSEPSMSHIYSFAFVNLFVYSFLIFFKSNQYKFLILGVFAIGIITLIRPINILVVVSLPFIAGNLKVLADGFRSLFKKWQILLLGIALFTLLISIQLVIYKIQTGKFVVYSYTNEGFNFLNPHFFKFMFSYRKGFFIYTPILFLALFGLIYFFKNRFKFFSLLIFLLLIIYVFSSWWMWYYGGSFSQRVMIEYYIYFFIPFATLLKRIKFPKTIKIVVFLLIIICQIQTYQYQRGYIHWSEMNKERYWDNFLRLDKVIKGSEKEWE